MVFNSPRVFGIIQKGAILAESFELSLTVCQPINGKKAVRFRRVARFPIMGGFCDENILRYTCADKIWNELHYFLDRGALA
jgi:hypothetical protein